MGNLLACRALPGGATVILPDGKSRRIRSAVTAADLMLEHPCYFVSEMASERRARLPADHTLEAKKVYVMLPMAAAGKPQAAAERLESLPSKAWKPSLRTIEEWSLVKKVPHWLL